MGFINTTPLLIAALVSISTAAPTASAVTLQSFTDASVPGYELLSTNPSALGIDTVNQQSGYLNTPSGDRLFYWFFESRDKPSTDPVLIWLNGGPGCSSLQAVVVENGPSKLVNDNGQLQHNQWSFNNYANVLYIDSPAGVGFSTGRTISDTVTASVDFKNAVKLFFAQNPKFAKSELHISGESYAGRYIPVFATAINEFDSFSKNITSVLIGNGLVNPVAEYQSYQPMLCGKGGFPQKLSDYTCTNMQQETPQCTSQMTRCMNDEGQDIAQDLQCTLARFDCNGLQSSFSGLNPYDIRDNACKQTKNGLCYSQLDWAQDYFNRADVQSTLGVSPRTDYSVCDNAMNSRFYQNGDPFSPTFKDVTTLLEQNTAVLAFNGDADIILNWLGATQWTKQLQWSGQREFSNTTPKDWTPVNGEKRGEITNYGNFTFLRVHNAGHMVPLDQPESANYMVQSWLSGDYGFAKTF